MLASLLLKRIRIHSTGLRAWQALCVSRCTASSDILAGKSDRRSASSSGSPGSKAIFVPMPKLSPSMTEGTVAKWLKVTRASGTYALGDISEDLKGPGDEVEEYDVLMEIETETLTEEAYKVDEFAGKVTLLVEAQEDGYVHSILIPEGKTVPVGTPVALLTEYEEDLHTLDGYEAPTDNLYAEGHGLRTLTWQSYLRDEKAGERKGCS